MSTAVKRLLSGSTDGRAIKIAATATPGTLIHTAQISDVDGTYDEVWLWAYNSSLADLTLTLEWGGVAVPDDTIAIMVPCLVGLVPLTPGLVIHNSKVVRAFAGLTNIITIVGFVNQIQDGWEIDR
jgi:hypothetical protein